MTDANLIEFKPATEPKLKSIRMVRSPDKGYCAHRHQLLIDEDTQLVECSGCHLIMSAYAALMVIVREWKQMHYDTTKWEEMKAEQAKEDKAGRVRRIIRQLQWIELPSESEPEARRYWELVTAKRGEPPYAMFRRGQKKGVQYCILDKSGAWTDVRYILGKQPMLEEA